jgi:hypothetical protein
MSIKDIFDNTFQERPARETRPEELERCIRLHCIRCNRCLKKQKRALL